MNNIKYPFMDEKLAQIEENLRKAEHLKRWMEFIIGIETATIFWLVLTR